MILLILITCGLCGITEAAARIGLGRLSQIHRRILQDKSAAIAVRPARTGEPKTMLFCGNSLLLEGVDFHQLGAAVSSRFRPVRFVVEQTFYYDWEFGIRSLLRHGARPDHLILCLSPGQFRRDAIRGDFDARFLFDLQDIWPVSRYTQADLTATSSLYFAHFSSFYGARSELRGVLLGKAGLGRVQELWHDLVTVPLVETDHDMVGVYVARLKTISELCAAQGVRFQFLIPPTAEPGDGEIVNAGRQSSVPVIHPVPNYSLGTEYYRDNFHLNARGAKLYTEKISAELASVP